MADTHEWKAVEQQILNALDIAAEYQSLGVHFAREGVSEKGWRECHAIDRKDSSASAAVNVGNGIGRGRYRDMGGTGLSLNLWEFAAQFGKYGDWRAARKHYAEKAGVKMPAGSEPKRPADGVEFLESAASNVILAGWAETKGGFDLDAVRATGGLYGRYPKKSIPELSQFVVAFPAHNPPGLVDAEPSAWVIANITGAPVRLFQGKNKPPTESKTLSVGGSLGGLLGQYGLLALMNEREGGPAVEVIWKAEGLSDVLALHAALRDAKLLGKHIVLSNSQGTLETVKPEWVELCKGKIVYVVHDRDRPGLLGANRWCDALVARGIDARNVALPYSLKESHGEDVRDYLNRDKSPFSELLKIAEETPTYTAPSVDSAGYALGGDSETTAVLFDPISGSPTGSPAAASGFVMAETSAQIPLTTIVPMGAGGGIPSVPALTPQAREASAILDLVGIDVLGEYTSDKGKIEVYSRNCKKVVPIDSIDHFSYRRLIQMCGEKAFHHVHDGKDRVEGKHTMEEVRQAVALKASPTDLSKVGMIGQGIWKSDGFIVVVNGGTAAIYDRSKHCLGRINNPRVTPKTIIDFSATEPWVDFVQMNELITKAGDRVWAQEVIQEARRIFANWNWKHPQDSLTTVLLVAATFIQTTLAWRPEVAITGPSDCGKSTIATTLSNIFGGLNLYVQKPTEAGLRQHMANTAKAVLIDEFENDGHRQKILEMLRTTSQGGDVIRGSSDQKGKSFRIKHIPWMMAIESGLIKAADRNRFIVLDLQAVPARTRGRLILPGELALRELGLKICAIALRYADAAAAIFSGLKSTVFDGIHGRVIESFSVPASLYAAITGVDASGAVRCLGELLADRTSIGRQGGGDEADLMKTILDSTFQAGSGLPPVSVADVISDPEVFLLHHTTLESQGIAMTEGRPGQRRPILEGKKFIFMDLDKVKRYLLRGTPWWSMDCEQLLLRVTGASRQQRKMGSQRIWGIEIPVRDWVEMKTPDERASSLLPDDLVPVVEPAVPEPEAAVPAAEKPTAPELPAGEVPAKSTIFQAASQKLKSLGIKTPGSEASRD